MHATLIIDACHPHRAKPVHARKGTDPKRRSNAAATPDLCSGPLRHLCSGPLRWLDFGSGQERGVRGAARERLFEREEAGEAGGAGAPAEGGGGLPPFPNPFEGWATHGAPPTPCTYP